MNIRYERACITGKHCVPVYGFRDLVMAEDELIRTGMVVIIVLYSIQIG